MITERAERYRDKFNILYKRIDEITEWTRDYSEEDFVRDEKTKLACYKAFQEAVEALTDISAMLCKDMKVPPKDDYYNILKLEELGVLDKRSADVLRETNGLRNRLVHMYNSIDDIVAFGRMTSLLDDLRRIAGGLERWVRNIMTQRLSEETSGKS